MRHPGRALLPSAHALWTLTAAACVSVDTSVLMSGLEPVPMSEVQV